MCSDQTHTVTNQGLSQAMPDYQGLQLLRVCTVQGQKLGLRKGYGHARKCFTTGLEKGKMSREFGVNRPLIFMLLQIMIVISAAHAVHTAVNEYCPTDRVIF